MTPDDSALLERARCGDRHALATIYDEYSPAIYRYLYRRVGNAGLAEDLTGQVFLKLLEAFQRDQLWNSSFRGWLYRIAHNLVVDHYRKQGDRSLVELEETLESDDLSPERGAELTIRFQRIRGALNELTEEQAQVILLRFGEGLSNREVGEIMEKSEGAIKALQHRALSALRRLLMEEVEG
jgi:RNA polymerase sigma-70 factor (ECF subfamily)